MIARLPGRTREAIRHRADGLGIVPPRKFWTPSKVATLKRLWSTATHADMLAALPRWPMTAIDLKAHGLGLKGRGKPPLLLTGNLLCDAIRDRCQELGYPKAYLDRIARSGTYFQHLEWRGRGGHLTAPMFRAINSLGGVLNVEWPD